jgi:hypothetical protein
MDRAVCAILRALGNIDAPSLQTCRSYLVAAARFDFLGQSSSSDETRRAQPGAHALGGPEVLHVLT